MSDFVSLLCMTMYICMYIYMHVFMYVCTYINTYVLMNVCYVRIEKKGAKDIYDLPTEIIIGNAQIPFKPTV